MTYRLAVGPSFMAHVVADASGVGLQPGTGFQFWPSLRYSKYCSCMPAPTRAAGQPISTVPSSCGLKVIAAFGGHVTSLGSGGATGAGGKLILTRGMSVGANPMYTTSRASGSCAHVAERVTLAHRS